MNLVLLFIGFAILYTVQLILNRSFILKLLVITYLFLVSSVIYFSFDSYKGWPTNEKIHKAFLLKVYIVEPTPDTKGGIYLWTIPEKKELNLFEMIFNYSMSDVPRAYVIPYSDKAQQEFTDAQKKIDEGMIVMLDGDTSQKQGNGEQIGDGTTQNETTGDNGSTDSGQEYNVPHISIISPDQVMRK